MTIWLPGEERRLHVFTDPDIPLALARTIRFSFRDALRRPGLPPETLADGEDVGEVPQLAYRPRRDPEAVPIMAQFSGNVSMREEIETAEESA